MKGLLLKDFYTLKGYKKNIIWILIMYSFLILSQEENNMMSTGITMFMILGVMISFATFNYDEKTHTNRYLLTLPISKKELVLEKYIFSFLCLCLGALLGGFISVTIVTIKHSSFPDIEEMISMILGEMTGISLLIGIEIPCMIKYGVEKGRIQLYMIAIILVLLGTLLSIGNLDFSTLSHYLEKLDKWIPLLSLLWIFQIQFLSYKISCKIIKNKEL